MTFSEIIYENSEFNAEYSIPQEVLFHSEMAEVERRFINGLIQCHKPRNLLEVGVSQGAGTCVLLNAISELPDTKLTSIDIDETYYRNANLPVGYLANKYYPDNLQLTLIRGKDPSEVMKTFDTKFDFCIIDTAHIHPCESLNFLTVLPFLSDDAIVVIHDLSAFVKWPLHDFPYILYANALCFNSVVGEKAKPVDRQYLAHCGGLANIGAIKICSDTRKYISNVFDNLSLPWGQFVSFQFELKTFFESYYDKQLTEKYRAALLCNYTMLLNDFNGVNLSEFGNDYGIILDSLNKSKRFILYGYGRNAKKALANMELTGCRLPDEIWDINANLSVPPQNCAIKTPEWDSVSQRSNNGTIVLITIEEKYVSKDIAHKFYETGFRNVIFYPQFDKAVLNFRIKSFAKKGE
jgi:predicted O-methyltransferase YrrM